MSKYPLLHSYIMKDVMIFSLQTKRLFKSIMWDDVERLESHNA